MTTNQHEIVKRFCDDNIIKNQTKLVDKLIKLELVDISTVIKEVAEICNPNTGSFEFMDRDLYEDLRQDFTVEIYNMDESHLNKREKARLESIKEFLEADTSFDYQEVLGWYIVSEYLEQLLKDEGEIILETEYGKWWGRQCTGQSVCDDAVIFNIVKKITNEKEFC